MTHSQLKDSAAAMQQYVWKNIGARKYLVGRQGVCKITMIAVQRWPATYSESFNSQPELCDYIVTQMRDYKGCDRKYGSIWIILLSAVAAQVVRVLLEWWLERRENRELMSYMRTFRGEEGQQCL